MRSPSCSAHAFTFGYICSLCLVYIAVECGYPRSNRTGRYEYICSLDMHFNAVSLFTCALRYWTPSCSYESQPQQWKMRARQRASNKHLELKFCQKKKKTTKNLSQSWFGCFRTFVIYKLFCIQMVFEMCHMNSYLITICIDLYIVSYTLPWN